MKKLLYFLFVFFISLRTGTSFGHFTEKGHVHTLSETKQVFANPNCRATDTCDLKRFALTTSVYEVWFSDDPNPTFGNGVIMEYETDSVNAIEKYAIVQFNKGCVFYSSKDGNGRIISSASVTVPSFSEKIPFCFRKWVIDSQDTDPVYNSDPDYGRFYFLRWNEPGSYDEQTQKFYGTEKPKTPVVYMTDYPGGAFVGGTGVKNVAVQFKTCIYKANDVPLATRRERTNFAKALNCFRWQNVYVYDFDSRTFQTNLANVPKWERPSMRVDMYWLVISATLLIGLALFISVLKKKRAIQVRES